MDEKLAESIKKNKGILRQLTALNNKMKDFEKRLDKLEKFKFNNLGYYEINETG